MTLQRSWLGLASALLLAFNPAHAITLNPDSTHSVNSAMSQAAYDMMTMYVGNQTGQTPGMLPYADPQGYRYYWWQAGAMMGTLIDYWYYTGDTTYNDEITTAMLWQAGPDANYEPQNESLQLGNDDQSFWAFSAMMAAEYAFPNPPPDKPQWLELAQAVFNLQVERWDKRNCGGGLRWQIFEFNVGYNYKNSISNGCLMQLSARLAKYTGNSTYAAWAEKEWNWMEQVGLITSDYTIWDGITYTISCHHINRFQWSYTYAVIIYGAAVMWNITQSTEWEDRINGLLSSMQRFFANDIFSEPTCMPVGKCNSDQQSFGAYSGRFLSATTRVAPFTLATIKPWLFGSAQAAAASCTGAGPDGGSSTFCGLDWTQSSFDGKTGIGEQMDAIEFFGSLVMLNKPGPVSAKTGGTSKGNPAAGTGDGTEPPGYLTSLITTSDRAGAGIITAVICFALIGSAVWMLI